MMKRITMCGAVELFAAAAVAASGATVTLAPPSGTSTNVLALYAGETSVEIAGPGTVSLNPANTYTGGTTLSGGTLAYSGTYHDGVSPLGSGTFSIASADAVVSGSGTIANAISATQIANFAPEGTIALSGNNVFSTHIHVFQNTLEVTVVNPWHNRLVGDKQPDCGKAVGFTSYTFFDKDSPLIPSGLVGPVTIETAGR